MLAGRPLWLVGHPKTRTVWPAGEDGNVSYLIESEVPEGSLDRFFISRRIAHPVRVTDAFEIKDVLPAVEYALMIHRI